MFYLYRFCGGPVNGSIMGIPNKLELFIAGGWSVVAHVWQCLWSSLKFRGARQIDKKANDRLIFWDAMMMI